MAHANLITNGETKTEAAVVAELAQEAADPSILEAGALYAIPNGTGGLRIHDTEQYDYWPKRKKGVVCHQTAESFNAYLAKHWEAGTEVWADTSNSILVAVINAHQASDAVVGSEGQAGWGDHRASITLTKTPEWQAWEDQSGKLMPQAVFAEFIEDRAMDIRTPSSADVLELAQTFQAQRGVSFESATRLSDGNVQVEYREDTKATAGKKAQIAIPEAFELGLVPYEGSEAYKVTARFRYRLNGDVLGLGFKLDNPDKILREAFSDVTDTVAEKCKELGVEFYYGRPRS